MLANAGRRRFARLRAEQDGFGLVELMVAVLVLTVGIAALVGSFDSSRNLVAVAERESAAVHQAEQELERLQALPYDQIAQPSLSPSSTDPEMPGTYKPSGEPEVVVSGSPTLQRTWSDGRLSGEVVPFITWVNDDSVSGNGNHDLKRITVVVTLDGDRAPVYPIVVSTVVRPPS